MDEQDRQNQESAEQDRPIVPGNRRNAAQDHGHGTRDAKQKDQPPQQSARFQLPWWLRALTIPDYLMVFFTACIFVATGVYAWIADSTLYEMHQDAIMDERAWVGSLSAKISTFMTTGADGKRKFVIEVPFTNFGKTPALHTHAWIGTTPGVVPSANPISDPTAGAETLYPQDTGNTSAWLPPSAATDIRKGLRLATYGTLFYNDIFGKPHWAQFCFYVAPNLKSFSPCPTHNGTDDEQQAKDNPDAGASSIFS